MISKACQTFEQPRSCVLWDGSWFHMESVTPEQKFAAVFGRAPPSPSIPSSSSSSRRSALLPVSSSPLWSMYVVGYFSAWDLGSGSETRLITPLCSRRMAQSTSRQSRGEKLTAFRPQMQRYLPALLLRNSVPPLFIKIPHSRNLMIKFTSYLIRWNAAAKVIFENILRETSDFNLASSVRPASLKTPDRSGVRVNERFFHLGKDVT